MKEQGTVTKSLDNKFLKIQQDGADISISCFISCIDVLVVLPNIVKADQGISVRLFLKDIGMGQVIRHGSCSFSNKNNDEFCPCEKVIDLMEEKVKEEENMADGVEVS